MKDQINAVVVQAMTIQIRGEKVDISRSVRQLIDRKCRLALSRVAERVSEVRITVRDINGPRHGMDDVVCTLDIRLSDGAEVHVEARDSLLQRAAASAVGRAARSLQRLLGRRRLFRRETVRSVQPVVSVVGSEALAEQWRLRSTRRHRREGHATPVGWDDGAVQEPPE